MSGRRWSLAALALLAAATLASADDESAHRFRCVQVWGDPPPAPVGSREVTRSIQISGTGDTALLVGEQVRLLDLGRHAITRRSRATDIVAVSRDWRRGIKVAGADADAVDVSVVDVWTRAKLGEAALNEPVVHAAAFSRDESSIILATSRGLRVRDAASMELKTLVDELRDVTCFCEVDDGRILVSGPGGTRLWTLASPREEQTSATVGSLKASAIARLGHDRIAVLAKGSITIYDSRSFDVMGGALLGGPIAATPDGDRFLVGDEAGVVHVFTSAKRPEVGRFRAHLTRLTAMAVAPDGETVVSAGEDGSVAIWKLSSATAETTGHRAAVTALAVSRDGSRALSGCADGTVRLWDARTGAQLRSLEGHGARILAVALSSDGLFGASSDEQRALIGWDLATGAVVRSETTTERAHALAVADDGALRWRSHRACAPLPEGRWLVADASGLSVDERDGDRLVVLANERRTLAATPDGRWAVVIGAEVELWDLTARRLVRSLGPADEGLHRNLAISADGKYALDDGALWTLDGGWVCDRLAGGDPVAFVSSRSVIVGSSTGLIFRYDR